MENNLYIQFSYLHMLNWSYTRLFYDKRLCSFIPMSEEKFKVGSFVVFVSYDIKIYGASLALN